MTEPALSTQYTVFGNCPVQALGIVHERELFFRARQDAWSFEVADQGGQLPSDGGNANEGFYREELYPNAGWMPLDEVLQTIEGCLREYLATRRISPGGAAEGSQG